MVANGISSGLNTNWLKRLVEFLMLRVSKTFNQVYHYLYHVTSGFSDL